MPIHDQATSRRRFLQFLAASPLLAGSDLAAIAAERPSLLPDPMLWGPRTLDKLISSPKEAINVFDFELVAAKNIPPAHFAYMASGIDDEVTLRANREGFLKFQLRPRRLVDAGVLHGRRHSDDRAPLAVANLNPLPYRIRGVAPESLGECRVDDDHRG